MLVGVYLVGLLSGTFIKRSGDTGRPDEVGHAVMRLVQVHSFLCTRGSSQLHSVSQEGQGY